MFKTECVTFDDVLIEPAFSSIASRKDVDLTTDLGSLKLSAPLLSANMDTVFSISLAQELHKAGGCSVAHRFCSIEENVQVCQKVKQAGCNVIASVGIGTEELDRAVALIESGIKYICIDVAHGAQDRVVKQYNLLVEKFKNNVEIIVGNFATGKSISDFKERISVEPMAFKVGIGGGSACLTREQTGCGVPQLHALIDSISKNPQSNIISDGAHKKPGDVAKALAVGAKAVMLGYIFSASVESPGEVVDGKFKHYRGSASLDSYKTQGKEAAWRTFEGDSFLVPITGSVQQIVQNITGGVRSALTYVGASNLQEFSKKANLLRVSANTHLENTSHGNKQR